MRHIIYFSIVLLIASCSNLKRSIESTNFIVNSCIIRSFDTISYLDTGKLRGYDIKLSIINQTQKPLSFWIMTCSWDENFVLNNDYIKILPWACDSNYPHVKHLGINDSLTFNATVIRIKFTKYPILTTRFGFICIDTIKCKNASEFMGIIGDKSKQDKIIWSNPLYLRDL